MRQGPWEAGPGHVGFRSVVYGLVAAEALLPDGFVEPGDSVVAGDGSLQTKLPLEDMQAD